MEQENDRDIDGNRLPFGQTLSGNGFPRPEQPLPSGALKPCRRFRRSWHSPSPSGTALSPYRAAAPSSDTLNQHFAWKPADPDGNGLSPVIDTPSAATATPAFSPQINVPSFRTDNAVLKPASAGPVAFGRRNDTPDYIAAAANEGFHLPDSIHSGLISSDSPEQRQPARQETVRIRHSLGNEGFTLSPDTPEQASRFRTALETAGRQAGTILSGQERETRFAYGMPAKGENTRSVWRTYINAKQDSDTLTHEDDARHLNRLADSGYGTGITDLSHSLVAGGYDTGGKALAYGYLAAKPLTFMLDKNLYTDPQSGITYRDDPGAYLGYPARRFFYEKKQAEKAARSEAYRNADFTNPGYLPVKAAGTLMEDPVAALVTFYLTRQAGLENATAVSMATSAVSDYNDGYDRTVAEWMDKPQDEIVQNRVYRELRKQGLSDDRARFVIGHTLGERQAKRQALAGALRAYAASRLAAMSRTGEEGKVLKNVQDYFSDKVVGKILERGMHSLNEEENKQ